MVHDDQARGPEEQGSAFSKADTCSMASRTSSSSQESSLVADGEDGNQDGHVNLMMNDLLNQPLPSSVNIANSTDVRIGPSLHYNGPVTVNQYLNLQQGCVAGLGDIPLPQSDGTGKGVLSGVAASGVGASADASKRAGGDRGALWWRRPKVLAAAGVLVVLLAAIATMLALLWPKSGGDEKKPSWYTTHTDPPPDPALQLEDGRRIVSRSSWNDVAPKFRRRLHHPTPYVIIGHTAGTACRGEVECFALLCAYRDEHRTRWEQPDIVYNFLIDVQGNIYEGRGWDATNNFQSWATRCNLAVSFMGNFMNENVTQAMTQSLEQLLRLGLRLGKLDPDYRLVAHNQVVSTLSPGENVLKLIENWPHRCFTNCYVGVQCVQADTTEASTTALGGNETANS